MRCRERDAFSIRRPRKSIHIQARIPRDLPCLYWRLPPLRVTCIHNPHLVLPEILFEHLILAVFFLPLFLVLAFRARRSKRNLLPIFRPVKSSDISLLLRQLPSLAALRRNHPNLSSRRLSFALFFLIFPFFFVRFFPFGFFLFRRAHRNNRVCFPLPDKCQPPPIWRPFRCIARLLSSRQLKARPASHVDQPDLAHILPVRFP